MPDQQFRPYKYTGNIAVDMVAACINAYHLQGLRLRVIRLNAILWTMFRGYALELIPGLNLANNEIDFDGVIIAPARVLSNQPISWEFERGKKLVNKD